MRLKTMDGPVSIHNGNNEVVNSPKRINTIQNSNETTIYHSSTSHFTNNSYLTFGLSNNVTTDVITELQTSDLNVLSNVIQDKVQWCNPPRLEVRNREITNNCRNINNTLAATLGRHARRRRATTASSLCSESSPDDSLFDFEDAEQSYSSADTSPQEEDRPFDISDSESSEDGNLSHAGDLPQRRGIVNPNYPGFQHLAHTLASDAETEDEFDAPTSQPTVEANNNNDVEGTDYKIDSLNRLDSVENIQKVFYDKPAFNIEQDDGNGLDCDSTSGNSNNSDEDTETRVPLNINVDEKGVSKDIVGDYSGEIEAALVRVTSTEKKVSKDPYQLPKLETAVVKELEEAVEKLMVLNEIKPSVTKYNIKPNIEEPLDKLSPTKQIPVHQILEDYTLIQNTDKIVILQEHLPFCVKIDDPIKMKIGDAFLSNGFEDIEAPLLRETSLLSSELNFEHLTRMEENEVEKKFELVRMDANCEQEELDYQIKKMRSDVEVVKFHKENLAKDYIEKDQDNAVPRKKEKNDISMRRRRDYNQQFGSLITFPRRENGARIRETINRRSLPMAREKKKNIDTLGGFDVYNIETAMPKIDLEAIECHLRAAREEERRRRTDREEIRRRLATGSEEEFYSDRPGRKSSLQARLQSGMNLQICFMNESLSDTDSPTSDSELPTVDLKLPKSTAPTAPRVALIDNEQRPIARPATLAVGPPLLRPLDRPSSETDFFAKQARLQTEARMALAQAKEMARMQMEIEKQRQKKSPITEMIRNSMEKVGIPFPEEKRRLSRKILTDMNVAQLQVIVNDLHTQIETLNESLVKFLMNRDDLHMEQDSMLVDIEDLTRYLGAKEHVNKDQNINSHFRNNNTPPSPAPSSPLSTLNSTVKPHLNRIANLVKK